MHFYTSVNINYLSKARVLAKSVKKYCPDSRFSLVYSDKWPEEADILKEPFDDVILIEDLGIPIDNLDFWIFQHTVVELCTAVKGQALVKFLKEGSEKVVYLDPDIVLFHTLTELENLMEEFDVILTPHQTLPEKSRNDIIHNEICSLQHGAYNFGFYAVHNTANGSKFAQWWRDRLVDFCFDDIPNGIFTDQKWGDIVPAMFDGVHILRDPGYNVSTWNLSNREVTRDSDANLWVNGRPMQFYHFSGFDSGSQAEMLKMYGNNNPILYQLRQWYIQQQALEGQIIYESKNSKYNCYDNGEKIEKAERQLLRMRHDLINYFKGTNPYIADQERSYYNWYRKEGYKEISAMSELEKIYSSRSWKIASFMSKIYKKCKGYNFF